MKLDVLHSGPVRQHGEDVPATHCWTWSDA